MEEQEIEAAEIIRAGGELGRLCLRKDGFLREAQPQTQSVQALVQVTTSFNHCRI